MSHQCVLKYELSIYDFFGFLCFEMLTSETIQDGKSKGQVIEKVSRDLLAGEIAKSVTQIGQHFSRMLPLLILNVIKTVLRLLG